MANRNSSPVFVHAWWRTSSTYVWGKLRENTALRCYSEPLHEAVSLLTLPIVRGRPQSDRLKLLHHPPMARGYFAEYEPMLMEADTGFRKEFSYDRYFLLPQESHDDLKRYLEALIRTAHGHNQRPLLALVRSSLRAAWMRRAFGGLHLAQIRDPRQQWGSMIEQHRKGGTYFLAGVIAVAAKLRSRFPQAFSHVACSLVDYRGPNYNPAELGRYIAAAREIDDSQFYALFMLIWLASALQILSVSELALDCDRLSADSGLRAAVENRLAAEGLAVDFSDFNTPSHPALPLSAEAMQAIEAAATNALATHARALVVANADRVSARLDELAPRCAQLMRHALQQLQSKGFFSGAPHPATRANTPPLR